MLFHEIPEAAHQEQFQEQPLDFLRQARNHHGDIFLIRRGTPLFSGIAGCPGVLAVFGMDHQRAILTDIDTFGLPPSAIKDMELPEVLLNLNRSLHSMTGAEHMQQRRRVSELFRADLVRRTRDGIEESIKAGQTEWKPSGSTGLVALMRQLIFDALSRALFGDLPADLQEIPWLLRRYFALRREITSKVQRPSERERTALVTTGLALDQTLRAFIEQRRVSSLPSQQGLLHELVARKDVSHFSVEQLVGHCNILFISCTEPLPMALAWLFLVLSQSPPLRQALRKEIADVSRSPGAETEMQLNRMVLLDQVFQESLRLLSPNAFMTRVTTRTAHLNGVQIPANCELLLSPFLSHRDPKVFQNPDRFEPHRWLQASPAPYVYFPFGAGGHSCIGKNLAIDIMKLVAVSLLSKVDLLLAEDQFIDWSVNIFFAPDPDPAVVVHPLRSRRKVVGGVLHGPVKDLMGLEDFLLPSASSA